MLYDVCTNSNAYYVNCMDMFLTWTRGGIQLRNESYFRKDNIHLNNSGLIKLARKYLSCIHRRKFNPLGY